MSTSHTHYVPWRNHRVCFHAFYSVCWHHPAREARGHDTQAFVRPVQSFPTNQAILKPSQSDSSFTSRVNLCARWNDFLRWRRHFHNHVCTGLPKILINFPNFRGCLQDSHDDPSKSGSTSKKESLIHGYILTKSLKLTRCLVQAELSDASRMTRRTYPTLYIEPSYDNYMWFDHIERTNTGYFDKL